MLMLKEMEYVYAVYEEQSFSKAARKLYLSQPALSAAVRRAEAEIHTPIFDRSTNPSADGGGGATTSTRSSASWTSGRRWSPTSMPWPGSARGRSRWGRPPSSAPCAA